MPTPYPGSIPAKLRQATLAGYQGNTGPMSKILGDIGEDIEALTSRVGVTGSSDSGSLDYQMRHVEATYTPAISTPTGSLTSPSTVTGSYWRPADGKLGMVYLSVVATGTWSGSGSSYLQLSLPPGWTAAANAQNASGVLWSVQAATIGQSAMVFPKVAASGTVVSFLTRATSADGWVYALNGYSEPYAAVVFDLVLDGFFWVRLA